MFKNYFKTALRNLLKNKALSFINITGLSVGMAVALTIGLWIWDEVSFDKNFTNYDRIARVIQNVTNNGEVQTWDGTPYPLGAELLKSYGSDFKYVVRSVRADNRILSTGDKKLNKSCIFIDPDGAEMLSLKMIRGNREALKNPSSVLLSESTAKAFFGDRDPLSGTFKIDNRMNVTVGGVYRDFPQNCSFANLDFMASWQLFATTNELDKMDEPWRPNFVSLYVQMTDHADLAAVSLKIRDVKLRHVSEQLSKKKPALFLQPMSGWHLYEEYKNGINTGGRIQYVWLFGIIGLFVLLLACINFMNLSTARSEKRAREVGIRKAIGSMRSQLIFQFFTESLLCVLIASAFSLLLLQFCLPFFNIISEKQVTIPWNNVYFWVIMVSFSILTGILTGSYPAFYLSSFNPIKVLKGTFRTGRLASIPRKAMTILQFTVSVTLIIGIIVVFRQIQFAKERPVGYDRDRLIYVRLVTDQIHNHFEAVKADLMKTGTVISIAETGAAPTGNAGSTSAIEWEGKDPNLSIDFPQSNVSFDFGHVIGWQFSEGRDFSRKFLSDSQAVVINESAARFMSLKNPTQSYIKYYGHPFRIIGVVRNIISGSPYEQVKPTVYFLNKDASDIVLLKLSPNGNLKEALAKIETIFNRYNPAQPFDYQFVDQEYAKKFGNEERIGKLSSAFAGLAIFISCLGLFGMSSFMAEQRIKEIGVRKVLGASVLNLWALLSKEFIILVIISLLIAAPIAWYFMGNWLNTFEYRTELAWWIFLVAGASAMLITMLTVSYQSIKAAMANPVKSLKAE